MDEPWVQYNGAGVGQSQRVYLHRDHQNSIIALSNGFGTAVNTLRYDAYGLADSGNVGRFGYTGQAWLEDLGLYHYKARMYSPVLGRFMQTDPVGYADQVNLYAYVGNDPMNATDPSGMFGVVGFLIGAGIELGVQMAVDGKSLSEVDYGDVLVAGAVSAVIPGLGNALKVSANSAKVVVKSTKAIAKLSGQSANTLNKAQKLDQRIGKNLSKIEAAVAEAGKAAIVAGVHQGVKAAGKDAVPPITADSFDGSNTSDGSSTSDTSNIPPPETTCGSSGNTTNCGG